MVCVYLPIRSIILSIISRPHDNIKLFLDINYKILNNTTSTDGYIKIIKNMIKV